jgi:uncharacterized protein (TIGR00296 family)
MENSKEEKEITNEDYKQLCVHAFDILRGALKISDEEPIFPEKFRGTEYPLFVTWLKGKEKNLRGCIGTFSKDSLEKNLPLYSFIAAFKDSRFPPISSKEVKDLSVGVSLLVNFEDAENSKDWQVGKHGITIDFKTGGKEFHATFLPEVAGDRDWDHETTLEHLVQKAGYYGELSEIINEIKCQRYQSVKANLTYEEYEKIKEKK